MWAHMNILKHGWATLNNHIAADILLSYINSVAIPRGL